MGSRLSTILICAVAALSSAIVPAASAAPRLDPSFGEAGLSFTPPGTGGGGTFTEVDLAPDGSTLVSSGGRGTVRFGPEGTWDSSFAGSGTLNFDTYEVEPRATAVDSKGRLLVFGAELDGQTAPGLDRGRGTDRQ